MIWCDIWYGMIWYDVIWYDIYWLQLGYCPLAEVGRLVKKIGKWQHKQRNNTQNN